MTFSLHQGGVVMSSQIKHTHSHQDTPLSPYTWHLSLDFLQLRPFYSLSQPHHVTASLPSPCDSHQSMGERSERTQGQAKMAAWNSFRYICTRTLHSFRSFAHCRAAATVIPLLPKATFTPSIQLNHDLPRTHVGLFTVYFIFLRNVTEALLIRRTQWVLTYTGQPLAGDRKGKRWTREPRSGYIGLSHAGEIYWANLQCKFSVYGILYTVLRL